ncbi:hypothetical protein [Paenibacillus camerounensis]|uniref:hypothetical protein n=1 Tax=Paenibacillus camerounensis TaxID=1243663 RepID=UPI0005A78F85|nr:hypothetical protein [Paenibacillus camerounensis]
MIVWFRIMLSGWILFCGFAVSWFLYGATGHFRQGLDLMEAALLLGAGIPVMLIFVLMIVFLIKKWEPVTGGDYVRISVGLALSFILSAAMIDSVGTFK